ncbi:MAG: DUF2497 domain-containing protein [Hyphomicrobium sp.]
MADEASEFELPAIFKPGHPSSSLGDARPNLFGRLSDALKPTAPPEPDRSRTVIRFEPAAAGRMIDPPAPIMAAPRPEPAPAYNPAPSMPESGPAAPRVMATFFDTRMSRMSSAPAPEPRHEPRYEPAPSVASLPPIYAAPPQLPQLSQLPPALPDRADAQALGFGMEDAAAQMMRPILRQWLTENMPKIVEKALRSEADGGDHQPPPRKTLR